MYSSSLDFWYHKEHNDLLKKRNDLLDLIANRANTRDCQSSYEIIWEIRDLCDQLESTCKG